jgi:Oxidoreductase family, NAD-binding Rossmann fold
MMSETSHRLGVGFIGSGFVTRFHIRSWVGVRDADIRGIWSPNPEHAREAAGLARQLGVGDARPYPSLHELVQSPDIDVIWICSPDDACAVVVEELGISIIDFAKLNRVKAYLKERSVAFMRLCRKLSLSWTPVALAASSKRVATLENVGCRSVLLALLNA